MLVRNISVRAPSGLRAGRPYPGGSENDGLFGRLDETIVKTVPRNDEEGDWRPRRAGGGCRVECLQVHGGIYPYLALRDCLACLPDRQQRYREEISIRKLAVDHG